MYVKYFYSAFLLKAAYKDNCKTYQKNKHRITGTNIESQIQTLIMH